MSLLLCKEKEASAHIWAQPPIPHVGFGPAQLSDPVKTQDTSLIWSVFCTRWLPGGHGKDLRLQDRPSPDCGYYASRNQGKRGKVVASG